MRTVRVALAQINTTVGDLDGNAALIVDSARRAAGLGADLVAFPEMAVTGYPPEDLVFRQRFLDETRQRLLDIARRASDIVSVVGFVDGGREDGRIHNAAAVLSRGGIQHVYHKIHLPNYGVFDEQRYFTPGRECPVFDIAGAAVGVNVCEDIWRPLGPSEVQCAAGAELIVNINASPYEMGKLNVRRSLVSQLARRNRAFVAYVNQVGGQDELVFDGGSMVVDPAGEIAASARFFAEDLLVVDLDMDAAAAARRAPNPEAPDPARLAAIGRAAYPTVALPERPPTRPRLPARPLEEPGDAVAHAYQALVTGTRDYVRKTGFSRVVVALSGGIDSSLTAVLAVDALGAAQVAGVAMPSRYSSPGSTGDARELARRLGIELRTVPIEPAHAAFEAMLADWFEGTDPNVAEENVQARIRGNIMMTVANKFGWIVLTTGNKSEMATGYATLYGDMAGGFAVIKDVPKTLVYKLCEYRNRAGPGSPIPQSVIDKPPSAELKPGQLDQDSLPPYPILDRILERHVEHWLPVEEIIAAEQRERGPRADEETIRRVVRMVDRSEYKRRQAPPGVKITALAFGRDRRLPIASRYSE